MTRSQPRHVLLRPLLLGTILLLALNDWVFKSAYPGPVTGKLSDIAGLFAFPLVAWGAIDLLRSRFSRSSEQSATGLAPLFGVGVALAVFFTLLKLDPTTRALYLAPYEWVGISAAVAPDPTDLFCLPLIGLAFGYGYWHLRQPVPASAPALRSGVVVGFVALTVGTPAPKSQTRKKDGPKSTGTPSLTATPSPSATPGASATPTATPSATPK